MGATERKGIAPTNEEFQGALHDANAGNTSELIVYLDRGFDIDFHQGDGWTVLNMATSSNKGNTAKMLIDRGADLGILANHEWPTLCSAANKQNVSLCEGLLIAGVNPNSTNKEVQTGLHEAARKNNATLCELFIAHGADIEAQDAYGRTPMNHAADFASLRAAYVLIAYGGNAQGLTCAGHPLSKVSRIQAAARIGLDHLVVSQLDEMANGPEIVTALREATKAAKSNNQESTLELIRVWRASNAARQAVLELSMGPKEAFDQAPLR